MMKKKKKEKTKIIYKKFKKIFKMKHQMNELTQFVVVVGKNKINIK